MNFLRVFVFACLLMSASLDAGEQTGILGFSNPAKGFYVFGLKGLDVKDPICSSKFLIPEEKLALIDLVKVLDERSIEVTYHYQKIDGGGTRDHCIVSNVIVIKSSD